MLVVCPACRRHVRSEEVRCPFCDDLVSAPSTTRSVGRRSRSAIAALGWTVSACAAAPSTPSKPSAAPPTSTSIAAGDAGSDGGTEAGDATVASLDAAPEDAYDPIATGVLYGLPPPTTGPGGVVDAGVDPPKNPLAAVQVTLTVLKGAEPGDDAAIAKQRPFFRICYMQHAATPQGHTCPFSVTVGPAGTTAKVVCSPLVPTKLSTCLEHRLEIAPWSKVQHDLRGKITFEIP